jgi:hypothetical protein
LFYLDSGTACLQKTIYSWESTLYDTIQKSYKFLPEIITLVLSANIMGTDRVFYVGGRSSVLIRKSKGPKIDPWGTPCFIVPHYFYCLHPVACMTNNDTYLTVYATNFINYTTCFGPNGPSSGVSTLYIINLLNCNVSFIHRSYMATLVLTSTLHGDINLCGTIASSWYQS